MPSPSEQVRGQKLTICCKLQVARVQKQHQPLKESSNRWQINTCSKLPNGAANAVVAKEPTQLMSCKTQKTSWEACKILHEGSWKTDNCRPTCLMSCKNEEALSRAQSQKNLTQRQQEDQQPSAVKKTSHK